MNLNLLYLHSKVQSYYIINYYTGDEKAIDREIAGLKKLNKDANPELTTRLKHINFISRW